MTSDDYRKTIALNLANNNVATLVADLANMTVIRDTLQTRVAELEAQLSPKPEAPATD